MVAKSIAMKAGGASNFTEEMSLMIGLTVSHFPGYWSRTPLIHSQKKALFGFCLAFLGAGKKQEKRKWFVYRLLFFCCCFDLKRTCNHISLCVLAFTLFLLFF